MSIKYCLPIIKSQQKDTIRMISENQNDYDYFEIWLDYIKDLNMNFINQILKKYDQKLIFVFRRQDLEKPKMEFQKRIQVINNLSTSKCLLDFDIFSQKKEIEHVKKHKKNQKLIISYHDYKETPADDKLIQIIKLMEKINPEILKISTFCKTDDDALRLIDLLTYLKERLSKVIILGMGEKGQVTRIAAALIGNELNYAPQKLGGESAPGQLTKPQLQKILNNIKICYFVADPVEHSLSPKIHYMAYKALGIEKKFLFLRKRVKAENLKEFIRHAKKDPNFCGASISIPHKVEVMKYLDQIDKVAKKIGAVNTVVKKGNKLTGYNTDWIGIVIPLKQKLHNLKGKKATVLGAGGAARSAVYALTSEDANVTIFNRDKRKAQKLSEEFNCQYQGVGNLKKTSGFEIIINATKVGLNASDRPLVGKELINPNQLIFDVVYSKHNFETKLIKQAKQKGAKTISGVDMLIYQGVAQFELLTDRKISAEVLRQAIS